MLEFSDNALSLIGNLPAWAPVKQEWRFPRGTDAKEQTASEVGFCLRFLRTGQSDRALAYYGGSPSSTYFNP